MLSQQALIELGLSHDLETLTQRVISAAESLGFGLVSAVQIEGRFGSPSAHIQSFGNPPAAFSEASKSISYGVRDPLLGALLARPGFVSYDESFYLDAGAIDMWDVQAQFGYRAGLSVSLHQVGHSEVFALGVDGPDALPDAVARLRLQAVLRALALHAQSALERIARPANGQMAALTQSERKMVEAAAIAHAHGRSMLPSSSCDQALLVSASRKLGVRSVQGAALRVIDGGKLP